MKLFQKKKRFWIPTIYSEHGIITNFQRYKGILSTPMDLHQYPFDIQKILIKINSFTWADSDLVIKSFTDNDAIKSMSKDISMNEWDLLGNADIYENSYFGPSDKRYYSQLVVELTVKRKTGFYLQKIVSLVLIIGLMIWGIFLLPSDDLNDRYQITLTLLLACIAFNFVIVESLPKISYLTSLDKFFLVNYIALFLAAIENMIVYIISNNYGYDDIAHIIDIIFIIVFFVTYLPFAILIIVLGLRKSGQQTRKFKKMESKSEKRDKIEKPEKIE